MKKALKSVFFFILAGAIVFSLTGCKDPVFETDPDRINSTLSGEISISPTSARTGTELVATYTGTEKIHYRWKKDGADVGPDANKFKPTEAGNYSVTATRANYNPKTSNTVNVFLWNGAKPIIMSKYTADPSAHVWPAWNSANSAYEPRLFLYPSRDMEPAAGCDMMDRYHVFSTNNMVDWIDHGEILRRDNLPEGVNGWGDHHKNAKFMWAPDATYREGVVDESSNPRGPYFFFFPHATGPNSGPENEKWGATWKIGVAWSTDPHKGFRTGDPETGTSDAVILKDHLGNELKIGGKQAGNLIDPCVFVDEDLSGNKTYYFMTGGSQECRIAKLRDDMVSLEEPLTELTSMLDRYHEGPWMFFRYTGYPNKTGTKIYYLMYPGHASGGNGADMAYATSTAGPKGPWTYRGSILDPVGTGDTSHGSIVEFNGKWYLFYHNAWLSGGTNNLRSVCVDEVTFNQSGLIQKVTQTTGPVALNGPEYDAAQEAKLTALFGIKDTAWWLEPKDPPPPPPPPDPDDYNEDARYPVTVAPGSSTPSAGVTVNLPATIQLEAGDYVVGHFGGDGYLRFANVSGGTGGEALLELEYASNDGGSMTLDVQGLSEFSISCPKSGSWTKPYVKSYAVIELLPGNNTITISGGALNIRSMAIYFPK